MKQILGSLPNWKSSGPDLVQGLWLKNSSGLYERVRLQLKECLDGVFVPGWLTRERTLLLQEDRSKGNVASTYRPITCLSLMWKLLTGVIADQIYPHLDQKNFVPEDNRKMKNKNVVPNKLIIAKKSK